LNDYLSQDCGMTIPQATTVVLFFGFGNFLGMVIGGTGGDFLYKKNVRYPSVLSGSMAILGCFPFWILLNTTKIRDDNISLGLEIRILTTAILAGIGSGVTGPIVKATLQNVTLPHSRGQAFALLNTFDDFGRGLGPVFVAGLIISLGGRQIAFNVGIGGWVICGILNLCIYFTVANDEAKAKSIFLERYSRMTRVADNDDDALYH
jgi:sugar phosphate permease